MRTISIISVIFLILSACSSSVKNESTPSIVKPQTYANEFFSIEYPGNWKVYEEVNNINDSNEAFSKGIRATFFNPASTWPTVAVQKSAMFNYFSTPEEWRDLSVQLKQFDDSYIGTVESYMLDSLQFGPYPAALAGFVVVQGHDTIIHKQLVIMDGKDVYYLSNCFPWNDDGALQLKGDAILTSFRTKNEIRAQAEK